MQNWETRHLLLSEFLLTQLSMISLIIQGIWCCDCTWLRHLSTALHCVHLKGCTCLWKLKLPDRRLYLVHTFAISSMKMSKILEEIICCLVMRNCWVSKILALWDSMFSVAEMLLGCLNRQRCIFLWKLLGSLSTCQDFLIQPLIHYLGHHIPDQCCNSDKICGRVLPPCSSTVRRVTLL